MATIYGTAGNDALINGTNGADVFVTSLGNDLVRATAGADTYRFGYTESWAYWVRGYNDFDTLDYRFAWQSYGLGGSTQLKIVADLELGTIQKLDAAGNLLHTDTVSGVDALLGTAGADRLSGREAWDYEEFRGGGGNDTIDGRGGLDGVSYLGGIAVNVNLAAGTVAWATGSTDTLAQIEAVVGSNAADRFDATGFGGTSTNRHSFYEEENLYNPLAGNDTIVGNGATVLNFGNTLGGAIAVDLSLQLTPSTAANLVTGYVDDAASSSGTTPGTLAASGVYGVRGGSYDDTLTGGGHVNTRWGGSTVSGDTSLEVFRGNAGNDAIDGRGGWDRAEYLGGNPAIGIVVDLGAGTVEGDIDVGRDSLRGVESVTGTFLDDMFDARGFTLANAATPSANAGDLILAPLLAGQPATSTAFNEFLAVGGSDTVMGNGATQISFEQLPMLPGDTATPAVVLSFEAGGKGSGNFGNYPGAYGRIVFDGVQSVLGSLGRDSLTGAAGYQWLRGGYGNDTLAGGDGDDVLYGAFGGDPLQANPTSYSDDDSLAGGAGNDSLRGDFGNDTLDGGTGADTLQGGAGNDRYLVDDAGDLVVEDGAAGGSDTVVANRNWVLGANLERLDLVGAALSGTGNDGVNTLVGNELNNVLSGLAGSDFLYGLDGADRLNGGTGIDFMSGGNGADTFYVDDVRDKVVDTTSASDRDVVLSSVGFDLRLTTGAVENLTLLGTASNAIGNAYANTLTGNSQANVLIGLDGNDTLIGGLGNDTMSGQTGNDFYVVDSAGDVVNEAGPATDYDAVYSTVNWTLGANVEELRLAGTANLQGTGNALGNLILGNTGANTLDGGLGNDTLRGGDGLDVLTGGSGADAFVFESRVGADIVTDFTIGDDVLINMRLLPVGDGDSLRENVAGIASGAGFNASAEAVMVTTALSNLNTTTVAAALGPASTALPVGRTMLVVAETSTSTGVYYFQSNGNDATVSADELTLLGVLSGQTGTVLGDFVFFGG